MATHVHEFVSGAYPYESSRTCIKCGIESMAHWYTQTLTGDGCPWTFHREVPFELESACEDCGRCDCSEEAGAKAVQAMMCQMGECLGLHYDVWENLDTGDIVCDDCLTVRKERI